MLDARPVIIIKFLKRSLIVKFTLTRAYFSTATLESWHRATAMNSDNNAQHLAEQMIVLYL